MKLKKNNSRDDKHLRMDVDLQDDALVVSRERM